ncbi:MAG TPA: SDR family NAD(P)-dependent oxidoreductase [Opitutaceae bacterium]|nr:SDR family NAD(P)-dependent oxidoreductase [Opitutaceae bacterium]
MGAKVHPELRICNLSRSRPSGFSLNVFHIPCDLSRTSEVEHGASQVGAWLQGTPAGRVLLINNSGFGAYGRFPEPDLSRQLEMIDVNTRAIVQLTGLLLPALRARGGAIITVASTTAFQPTPYAATYGATKAFVLHWTIALNEELRGTGLRALAVCPGPTETDFFRRAGLGDGSISPGLSMTADQVVEQAMRALARNRSQIVTGWKNRLYAFAASRVSKPLAARVGARLLARFRLAKVKQQLTR